MTHQVDITYNRATATYDIRCPECGYRMILDEATGERDYLSHGDWSAAHSGSCGLEMRVGLQAEIIPEMGALADAIERLDFGEEQPE